MLPGLLGFGMYLQHVVGLEPCPMCIVQRYAMTLIALVALLGCFGASGWWARCWPALGRAVGSWRRVCGGTTKLVAVVPA